MNQRARLLLVCVLLAALAGCGSQQDAYCAALKDDQRRLSSMLDSGTPGALLDDVDLLRELADQAPDDLTDEWQTFLNAVEGLRGALRRAGIGPSQYAGGIPASVQGQKRQDVVAAASNLASSDVVDAAQGIETQARDVCKVNLGL